MTQRCILHGHSPREVRDVGGVRGYDITICGACNRVLIGKVPEQYTARPLVSTWNPNAPVVEMEIAG